MDTMTIINTTQGIIAFLVGGICLIYGIIELAESPLFLGILLIIISIILL